MFKKISYESENAAKMNTFVGNIYEKAVKQQKEKVLDLLPVSWRSLHEEAKIHIHDLEAYGQTYNCLSFDILKNFPFSQFDLRDDIGKILGTIEFYKEVISNMGNEQSGGIGFPNFDSEISVILTTMDVELTSENQSVLETSISQLLNWINVTRSRYGQECYYVTLNFGIDTTEIGRCVSKAILREYLISDYIIRPNIVFKVKKSINMDEYTKNFDLLQLAIECTCKKMNPTYLNCDTESNRDINPYDLSIMGCRTRVVNNLHGKNTSIGRGNFANISINLPRIALEIINSNSITNESEIYLLEELKRRWLERATMSKDILIHRLKETEKCSIENFPANVTYQVWNADFSTNKGKINCFEHSTLSIGFIGLSEAFEILYQNKIFENNDTYHYSLEFVEFMNQVVTNFSNETKLNFSLLATSGEGISRRFPEYDKKIYPHSVQEKGYYTNSFHINVDSNISVIEKIRLEGAYHRWCQGGSISYLELREVPIHNPKSIYEILKYSSEQNINYLGINFPLDRCRECKTVGIFHSCSKCGSLNISRVRRVSGYLEELSNFGLGKSSEERNRTENKLIGY